ncbi:MAG: hypothetical protein MZW92_51095 [Comamonadaceae bacterium]|nr:hypothetical protein [Comamonadaceae bacterium]
MDPESFEQLHRRQGRRGRRRQVAEGQERSASVTLWNGVPLRRRRRRTRRAQDRRDRSGPARRHRDAAARSRPSSRPARWCACRCSCRAARSSRSIPAPANTVFPGQVNHGMPALLP